MFDSMSQSTGFANDRAILAGLFLLLFSASGFADGTAFTVRTADLKSAPSHAGETIAELAKGEAVEVGRRQGAWFHVRTENQTEGWVRMLAVRYQTAAPSGSLLGALSRASRSKTTVATGVRGLDKEMLAAAEPNHARLQELIGFPYTASDARQFARQGGLKAREAAYP